MSANSVLFLCIIILGFSNRGKLWETLEIMRFLLTVT